MQQQRAAKIKVQCQDCRRSFVQRSNGNPWSHKCVPVRQVADDFRAVRPQLQSQVQSQPQVQSHPQLQPQLQPQPQVQPQVQVQPQRPQVLNFQDFQAHFELRFQVLGEEKKIEQYNQQRIQESLIFALSGEEKKLKTYFKEQESLDEIREELNDGLYLELCNSLLKEVNHTNKNIEKYKQELLRF